jgi:hypothetical protein
MSNEFEVIWSERFWPHTDHHPDDRMNLPTKYCSHVGRNPAARLEQVTFGVRSSSAAK